MNGRTLARPVVDAPGDRGIDALLARRRRELVYPVPLDDGERMTVGLPGRWLTSVEADRLRRFIAALTEPET